DESGAESRAIPARQTGLDGGLQIPRQGRGTLHRSRVPGEFESHQPPKMRKDSCTITVTGCDDLLHHVPDTILIEQAIHQAMAKQLPGFALRLFVDSH
ncbi:MAG TPA: hypothetical protein VE178_10365, partial [Silvibacterium sp.]|nr:hypothetical protein [Silvibacterium sp.]